MNRQFITTIALIAGIGLTGTAFAQGRWDERPHGYNAQLANAQKSAVTSPSATGGRHDEKPHGMTKMVAPKEAEVKPATTPSTVTPLAMNQPKSAGL